MATTSDLLTEEENQRRVIEIIADTKARHGIEGADKRIGDALVLAFMRGDIDWIPGVALDRRGEFPPVRPPRTLFQSTP